MFHAEASCLGVHGWGLEAAAGDDADWGIQVTQRGGELIQFDRLGVDDALGGTQFGDHVVERA